GGAAGAPGEVPRLVLVAIELDREHGLTPGGSRQGVDVEAGALDREGLTGVDVVVTELDHTAATVVRVHRVGEGGHGHRAQHHCRADGCGECRQPSSYACLTHRLSPHAHGQGPQSPCPVHATFRGWGT